MPPLEVQGESQDSSHTKVGGIGPHLKMRWGPWGPLKLWLETQSSPLVVMGISGNILCCLKGVKPPFKF